MLFYLIPLALAAVLLVAVQVKRQPADPTRCTRCGARADVETTRGNMCAGCYIRQHGAAR